MAVRRVRWAVLLAAGLVGLTACSNGAGSGAGPVSPTSSVSAARASSPAVPSASAIRSTESVTVSSAASSPALPDCAAAALQAAVNTGREASAQLTVGTDFQCAQDWAVAGGADTVNKAQYTYLMQWVDGAWQRVDRTQACAGQDIPADLVALACHSN